MKSNVSILATLVVFSAVVNVINIFSNDAALFLILLGFAALLLETSFWCCYGYHSWQFLVRGE